MQIEKRISGLVTKYFAKHRKTTDFTKQIRCEEDLMAEIIKLFASDTDVTSKKPVGIALNGAKKGEVVDVLIGGEPVRELGYWKEEFDSATNHYEGGEDDDGRCSFYVFHGSADCDCHVGETRKLIEEVENNAHARGREEMGRAILNDVEHERANLAIINKRMGVDNRDADLSYEILIKKITYLHLTPTQPEEGQA